MHGFNAETKKSDCDKDGDAVRACFARQLLTAREWAQETGGLICGDFNRVPCTRWRHGDHSLTADDRRLREATGWVCSCGAAGEKPGGVCDGGQLHGVVAAFGGTEWSRWRTSKGEKVCPTARLDYGIQLGEEDGWRESQRLPPEVAAQGARTWMASDHAYIVLTKWVSNRARNDVRRPRPFKVGERSGDPDVRRAFLERSRFNIGFEAEIEKGAAEARIAGESEVRAAVKTIVGAAAAASEVAAQQERERESRVGCMETPQQRFAGWMKRLKAACQRRTLGCDPRDSCGTPLHRCKSIARLARKYKCFEEAWGRIVLKCRREVKKAGADVKRARSDQDAKLYAEAKKMSQGSVNALVRMQRAWRSVATAKESGALESVWELDQPPKHAADVRRKITFQEEAYKPELGRIGRKCVADMADTPACLPAFEAWCEVFMEHFEPLKGIDGGSFDLVKELTWELFLEVLYSMPSGKAVGAGGFHAELLREAGEPAQRAFYKAMISDLKGHRIPEEWKVVLYALLRKKPPSRPDVVGQHREIALMAHDMKLLLQMVRRVSYQRMVGRIIDAQAGWLTGYGCSDPGSVAAHVIQQATRLKQPLWLLYIDLATFFPRIDRDVLTVAEALHGLPREVQQLAAMIYGSAAEPEKAVTCHYDSAAGLGDGFKNWMGALMGCVLSPDKAKILLNTVLVAIQAVCTGVRLWGHGQKSRHIDEDHAWRFISQAGFADDWLGMFASAQDTQRAWQVWRIWEDVSGSKLGVKNKLKTAVTGVVYEGGRASAAPDPLLRLRGGGFVPFMRHDEAYKHLGVWRRADGSDKTMWEELKRMLNAALARIRKLRKPSVNEFMMVSDALLGGIAGYYLQTFYITFEQAEEIERKWRAIYRAKFGGKLQEPESKPRAYFYQARGKGTYQRRHLWSVGLAAIAACVNNAMADADDTPQRAATRTSLALAMEAWGCREDPSTWQWEHLSGALEQRLKTSACKQLGEAWMLATCLMEKEHRLQWDESEGAERSHWARDFGSEQQSKWGRWREAAPVGDPMNAHAVHWYKPESTMLSEPVTAQGLGAPAEPWLLSAGVVAVGHMCVTKEGERGQVTHNWRRDFGAACRANRRLSAHGAVAKAWARQLAWLEAAGVQPEAGEHVQELTSRPLPAAWGREEAGHSRLVTPVTQGPGLPAVDDAAVTRTLRALAVPDVRARRSKATWRRSIQSCFPRVTPRPATEWNHGGRDRAQEARGARCVLVGDARRTTQQTGGEARWCRRREHDYQPGGLDESGFTIEADGWASGHQEAAAALRGKVMLDADGYLTCAQGVRIQGDALGELEPALQLMARARIEVGNRVENLPVCDEWPATKKKKTHVNMAVQRRNLEELTEWQAKIKATAAYTLDGTRDRVKTGDAGEAEFVTARAAGRHDGAIKAARIHEVEGADNYLAELAAHLDALNDENEGGRIILVFDATSPVLAMRKFRRMCHRKRQGYYAGEWLEALFRLIDRQEIVVFLWQTSHVGSAVNEWADLLAASAARQQVYSEVPRVTPRSASMRYVMPRKSTHAWATPLASGIVQRKLKESLEHAEMHEEFDFAPLKLGDEVQSVCDAVLSRRSVLGDEKRHLGRMRKAMVGCGTCPFGCLNEQGEAAQFTWLHAQIFCGQCDLVQTRREWLEVGQEVVAALENKDGLPHWQTDTVVKWIAKGLPDSRRGAVKPQGNVPWTNERDIIRMVGGLIRAPGDEHVERSSAVRKLLVQFVSAGARVQIKARELTKATEEAAVEAAVSLARAQRFGKRWLMVTRNAGPARVAALREVVEAAELVTQRIADRATNGEEDCAEAQRQMRVLWSTGHKAHITTGSVVWEVIRRTREEFPRQGVDAHKQWQHLSILSRWRAVAAARQRRWHGVEDPADDADAPAAIVVPGAVASCSNELATEMDWAVTSRTEEYRQLLVPVPELVQLERHAWRKWSASGGAAAAAKRAEDVRKAERKKLVMRRQQCDAAAGRRLAAYVQQTSGGGTSGQARLGLSGRALSDDEEGGLFLTIGPRSKRRRGSAAETSRPSKQSMATRLFESGTGLDRWHRHRVDRALEVRRIRGGTRLRGAYTLQVRIRWVGVNPATGAAWPDTWMNVYNEHKRPDVSPVLLKEVQLLEESKFGASIRGAGDKGRKRVAPDSVSIADSPAEKRLRKWRTALRSGDGPRTVHWWRSTRGRRIMKVTDDDEDRPRWQVTMAQRKAEALRDVKRKRAAIAAMNTDDELVRAALAAYQSRRRGASGARISKASSIRGLSGAEARTQGANAGTGVR